MPNPKLLGSAKFYHLLHNRSESLEVHLFFLFFLPIFYFYLCKTLVGL
jgi:hypothetical protein